jgi:hypothetical protein
MVESNKATNSEEEKVFECILWFAMMMIAEAEKEIGDINYFFPSRRVIRKAISASLSLFIISILLIPGTVALAAISKGGSSTMVRADSSNADNDSILKQQQLITKVQLKMLWAPYAYLS